MYICIYTYNFKGYTIKTVFVFNIGTRCPTSELHLISALPKVSRHFQQAKLQMLCQPSLK